MHLAQLNVARMVAPIDSETMRSFVEMLAPVNAIAESSPGFVWRDTSPAAIQIEGEPMMIVNFSIWETPEALRAFVYNGLHREVLNRRREWFELMKSAYYVLWRIEEGTIPTNEEALARLRHLEANGESDYAFTFRGLRAG